VKRIVRPISESIMTDTAILPQIKVTLHIFSVRMRDLAHFYFRSKI